MPHGRARASATFLASVVVIGLGVAVWTDGSRWPHPIAEPVPREARIGGPFRLTAHDGRVVTERSFAGKWLLVTFGFTHCADVCPVTVAKMAATLDRLGPLADRLQALFISVDPERDHPAVLARFLAAFDRRILGLSGTPDEVATVTSAYRVHYQAVRRGDARGFDHSAIMYLMGPDGRFLTHFSEDANAGRVASRLREFVASPARLLGSAG